MATRKKKPSDWERMQQLLDAQDKAIKNIEKMLHRLIKALPPETRTRMILALEAEKANGNGTQRASQRRG